MTRLLDVLHNGEAENRSLSGDWTIRPCPVGEDPVAIESKKEMLLMKEVFNDTARRALPGGRTVWPQRLRNSAKCKA